MPAAPMPAAIRHYPAPRAGQSGAMMDIPTLAVYCQYYGLRVRRLLGDTVILEPIPVSLRGEEPTYEEAANE